jgi:hypothetical protein
MKSAATTYISKHWDALLAATSACIFLYLFTRHSGIGISPDSVTYYSVAVNICNHFSFTDFNGAPLVDFPVGYPLLLAGLMWLTGFSPLLAAPVINIVLITGAILFTSIIIDGYQKRSSVYKIIFLSVLACSPALLEVYSMLWSETVFIFLSLLFFIASRHYFKSHNTISVLWMAIIAAFAFLTRYAGISLVVTGGFLLLFDGSLSIRKKIKHLLFFGCLSCSLTTINLILNHHTTASLTGVREKALRSVGENISQVSNTVAEWLPFLKGHQTIALAIFALIFAAGVLILFFRTLQQQYYHSYETIIVSFFVVYIVFLLTIASVSRFEELGSRLLMPVYIPFLLLASSWVVPLSKKFTKLKRSILLSLAFLFFAGMQYHQYTLNAEAWEGIKDAGIPGYTEDSWKESATIQYINQLKDSLSRSLIYSDAYDAIFFLSGLHAMALPHKEINKEINELLQHPSFSVIWLNDGVNDDLIDINFIRRHKKLVYVKQLEDGAVYFFSDSITILH